MYAQSISWYILFILYRIIRKFICNLGKVVAVLDMFVKKNDKK